MWSWVIDCFSCFLKLFIDLSELSVLFCLDPLNLFLRGNKQNWWSLTKINDTQLFSHSLIIGSSILILLYGSNGQSLNNSSSVSVQLLLSISNPVLWFQTQHVSVSEMLVSLEFHPNLTFLFRPKHHLGNLSHLFSSILTHWILSDMFLQEESVHRVTRCHPECQTQPSESYLRSRVNVTTLWLTGVMALSAFHESKGIWKLKSSSSWWS